MDIEQKQAEIVDKFVKKATMLAVDGIAFASLVTEATSHPSLFAFSEILYSPTISKLYGTQYEKSMQLLSLFVYGTWNVYKGNPGLFPILSSDQVRKLRQLTVLTLVQKSKVLPFDQLMQEIDMSDVSELEDFLINDCIYAGIVSGKLDSLHKCFKVEVAAARDPSRVELDDMIEISANWLASSDFMLRSIEEKIEWIGSMNDANVKHYKEMRNLLIAIETALEERKSCDDRKISNERRVTRSQSQRTSPLER